MEPIEGSNFCCHSNSNNHPNYGTKCFDSFDRKYLLQIPEYRNEETGFLLYIYVDDLFFQATIMIIFMIIFMTIFMIICIIQMKD